MQLHFTSIGNGQPLILLHGLFGSGDNWGLIAKHLSQHFEVISVDLRNHGRSPHSDSQSYTDMADDILSLCDALNLDQIHILGHSLGGKVAMQFATTYPDRMHKLIVVDMAIRAYQDEHTHLIDAMLNIDLSALSSRTAVDKALSKTIPNTMVRQFLLMNLVRTDAGLEWRINLPALRANYTKLTEAVCTTAHYDKPALFMRGERSHYVNENDIVEITEHFVQAELTSLPTDHWVHAEQPKAFTEAVSQFLKKH